MATVAHNSTKYGPRPKDLLPARVQNWLREKDRSRDAKLTSYVPGYFDTTRK